MAINNPYVPGDPYSYDLKWMVEEVKKAQAVGEEAAGSAEAAAASAEAAGDSAYNAANSASNALIFSQNAKASAENAADSAETAAGVVAPVTQALNTQGQQISVLEGRMDTFASLAEGSTTADAELQDIRVAADGTTYPTAGDAVRGQVNNLDADIDKIDDLLFSNVVRPVITYQYLANFLNNAYVWISTQLYVPRGQAGKLTCLNWSQAPENKELHVILLKKSGDNFIVISDQTIQSKNVGVSIFISQDTTKLNDVYFGFYSTDNAMGYQSNGRQSEFTRYTYNNEQTGDVVIPSGSYNFDFSFALALTAFPAVNKVYVDANGKGDYTSVLEAINNEPENTVINILPGIYTQDMTSCLRKRIILRGTDRNSCIIRDPDGRYGHHPLYISCGYFENLTIEAPYINGVSQEIGASDLGSYAVHIDTDADYAIGKTTEFHHCTLKSDFFPAVGLGMRKNANYIFDDCEFVNNQAAGRGDYTDEGTLGALYFHDSNGEQGAQYITIKNCVFTSNFKNAMCIYQPDRTPQENEVFCNFINNTLYSKINGLTDTIWFRGDPFNTDTGVFAKVIGFGNSIASLNL